MSARENGAPVMAPTVEELFEDAPCGYLSSELDGTITRLNRTFEGWTGLRREQLVGIKRFQDLLSPGGRIYYETHYAPLLLMQGTVSEIAVELVRADGSRLPAMINSVVYRDAHGEAQAIATVVFEATDRRRYEREVLTAGQREHEIAQRLQHGLLAGELPQAPGFEIATAYRSGTTHLEVGGDWHDAFWLTEPESLALVVGDVVGKGIDAAAAMGQLRSAARALALTGLGPGELLDELDSYARRYRIGHLATLVYAELNLVTGELRYACAGHPPPVLVGPSGAATLLWDGRSAPLAVEASVHGERPQALTTLQPGSALALYTDGLVGRRSHPLEDGLERVRDTIAAQRDTDVAALAPAVLRELRDDEHPDDACILVIEVTG